MLMENTVILLFNLDNSVADSENQGIDQNKIGIMANWFITGRILEILGWIINKLIQRNNWHIFGQIMQLFVVVVSAGIALGLNSF